MRTRTKYEEHSTLCGECGATITGSSPINVVRRTLEHDRDIHEMPFDQQIGTQVHVTSIEVHEVESA